MGCEDDGCMWLRLGYYFGVGISCLGVLSPFSYCTLVPFLTLAPGAIDPGGSAFSLGFSPDYLLAGGVRFLLSSLPWPGF